MENLEENYWIMVPEEALSNKELNMTDKMIYGIIYTYLNMNKKFFMSNQKIANKLGLSPRTVSRSISNLKTQNLIKIVMTYKEDSKEIDKRYIERVDKNDVPATSGSSRGDSQVCREPLAVDGADKKQVNKQIKKQDTKTSMSSSGEHDRDARKAIDYLNEKADKHYRYTQANLRIIKARLKDGFRLDDLKRVIDTKAAQWLSDSKMQQYLRPPTLFNASKFEGYLNEEPPKQRQGSDIDGLF